MSATPIHPDAAIIGFGEVSAANTARDGSGTIVDLFSAVSVLTRIKRIVVVATADPADGVVTLFLHNGSAYKYFDSFDTGNPSAATVALDPYRNERQYVDLELPSGWKLAAACTVALTSGVFNVFAFGEQLS